MNRVINYYIYVLNIKYHVMFAFIKSQLMRTSINSTGFIGLFYYDIHVCMFNIFNSNVIK